MYDRGVERRTNAEPNGDLNTVSSIMMIVLCALSACEDKNAPLHATNSSTAVPSQAEPIASRNLAAPMEHPSALQEPRALPSTKAPARNLYGASIDTIKAALQSLGWTPTSSRTASFKGVQCNIVTAARDGMIAEVRSFEGYPYHLQDMLELKGTAQGFGEMAMVAVLVKGNTTMTDHLYMQLMGKAPEVHGSGLGLPYNRR